MMKFFILYIGVFLISINLFGQIHIINCNQKMLAEHRKTHTYWNSKQQDSLCIIGLDSARKDVANGIIKYYNIGEMLPVLILLDEQGFEKGRLVGEKSVDEIKEFIIKKS